MIVRIPKSQQASLIRTCATRGIMLDFYTDERADGLCFADIQVDNNPALLFYIGREVGEMIFEDDTLFDLLKVKF
jgi:hypothetical protein